MSLAGVVSFGESGPQVAQVSASLKRMVHSEADSAAILQQEAVTLGAGNGAALWAGTGAAQGLLVGFNGVLANHTFNPYAGSTSKAIQIRRSSECVGSVA